MNASSTVPTGWPETVSETERNNGVVSLRPIDPDRVRQAKPFRVRLLRLEGEQWLVERPDVRRRRDDAHVGCCLAGVLREGSHRLAFRCELVSPEVVPLNDRQKVLAWRLSPPRQITCAQRRAYFRVDLCARPMPPATIWPLVEGASVAEAETAQVHARRMGGGNGNGNADGEGQAGTQGSGVRPEVGRPIRCDWFDLSGNGVGLIVDADDSVDLHPGERYWMELTLPEVQRPLGLVGELVRVDEQEGERMRLGFKFIFEGRASHEELVTDTICRFAAAEQRRKLQRQR